MSHLKIETDERGCRTLWLDRPAKRNALDEALLSDLLNAAVAARTTPGLRLVVLRSTSSMFCAGADLNDWADVTPFNAQRLSLLGARAFRELADLPVPLVVVVEGAALGGGFELALAGDIRIATTQARFGFPEARLGNTPAWGGVPRLAKLAGTGTMFDVLLTGDPIDGERAERLGIVQRLCAPEDLETRLNALIDSLLACDTTTQGFIKAMFGNPDALIAAQEAALAGFTATREEASARKQAFLASRRKS
ncbi:enoyl-CoA hydratase/isomerase family protein [Shinella sp.]|uniref:enoyl-CoA hydratase/isomerase family protein n=1 Tax=Shinella sp. TaxID=1870904 RepID=UPI0029A4FDBE|nr:enoyl-CoA hydratase/isomerase family protein [Shinella sp.]MDX3974949.1 enoyl-CoA hydratase/isomerase family protein [Shinella sp.]